MDESKIDAISEEELQELIDFVGDEDFAPGVDDYGLDPFEFPLAENTEESPAVQREEAPCADEGKKGKVKRTSTVRATIIEIITVLLILTSVCVIVSSIWMPIFQVVNSNMSPALRNGTYALTVQRGTYRQGDIIAFNYYGKTLIKRVIALGGETVNINQDGTVTVNGKVLDEPYVTQKSLGQCDITLPYTVPPNHLFVMGDDRATSLDSRTSEVGPVGLEQVFGKVVLTVWPPSAFGSPR